MFFIIGVLKDFAIFAGVESLFDKVASQVLELC